MTDVKYLPSYEEAVIQNIPPPPPYVSRVPSLVDNNYDYRFDNYDQSLAYVLPPRNARINNEVKHWTKKPCFLVTVYALAIFSCLFCGCIFGLLALFFIYFGERKTLVHNFEPNVGNKCNNRLVFPLVSLILSITGILIGITLLAIFLNLAYKSSSLECRDGYSINKTCCEASFNSCNRKLLRVGENGCRYCCKTKECLNLLRETPGCPKCQIYADDNDWNGCPNCCKTNKSCSSSERFQDSSGCDECCPYFSAEECLIHGTFDEATGCKSCCSPCQVNSTLKHENGCHKCCNGSAEYCDEGTYLDRNGCQKCCKPHIKTCSFYSLNYNIDICRQCCKNPPLYKCSYKDS